MNTFSILYVRKKAAKDSSLAEMCTGKRRDMLNLQVADRMKEYEEGIFQLLDEKKAEVEKTGKKV